jgi:uncharacterized membrane protein YgcG
MIPAEFFEDHWVATSVALTVCLWVSICLILQVWIIHRRAAFIKKLSWSVMLLIPGLGWLAYGALFRIPSANDASSIGFWDTTGGDFGNYDAGGHGGGGHGGGGHDGGGGH